MRKVSKAPAPIASLPTGHAAPQAKPQKSQAELKQPTASYYRFLSAVQRRDRHAAKFYRQKCIDEGLPEAQLKELALLDGSKGLPDKALAKRRRGRWPEKTEKARTAMLSALKRGEITPDQLDKKKQKELEAYGEYSRDILEKARRAALSEFAGNPNSDK